MARRKITVVGAGNVGATLAQRLAERGYADVVMVDIVPDMPQGKALDLAESAPVYGFDSQLIGTNRYDETAGSDIVVITSGVARKPGMSRDDLLKTNAGIVQGVTREVAGRSPNAVLIIVSNPLDAMTYVAYKVSGFPKQRVMGMAGVLDSSRFRAFIAQEMDVSVEDVTAFVLGGHGDTMVPLARYTTVAGIPLPALLPKERIDALIQRTRDGGAEIVKLLKTGSAYYAPSASVVAMVDAVLLDKKRILPCAVLCQGEYGLKDLFVGVPAKLGARGVESILEIQLTPEERQGLDRSAESVRELCGLVDKLLG